MKATVHKATKDTKTGIVFTTINGNLHVSHLARLFANTDLQIGDKVLSINSKPIVNGTTPSEARDLIRNIEGDVSIEVDPCPQILICSSDNKYHVSHQDSMPALLKEAGVPIKKWEMVVESIRSQLMVNVGEAQELRGALGPFYSSFVRKQMVKGGVIGFGQESSHELKAFQLHTAVATAHSNAVLAGANVLATATTLLAKYDILTQLVIDIQFPFKGFQGKGFADKTSHYYVGLVDKGYCLPMGLSFSKA